MIEVLVAVVLFVLLTAVLLAVLVAIALVADGVWPRRTRRPRAPRPRVVGHGPGLPRH